MQSNISYSIPSLNLPGSWSKLILLILFILALVIINNNRKQSVYGKTNRALDSLSQSARALVATTDSVLVASDSTLRKNEDFLNEHGGRDSLYADSILKHLQYRVASKKESYFSLFSILSIFFSGAHAQGIITKSGLDVDIKSIQGISFESIYKVSLFDYCDSLESFYMPMTREKREVPPCFMSAVFLDFERNENKAARAIIQENSQRLMQQKKLILQFRSINEDLVITGRALGKERDRAIRGRKHLKYALWAGVPCAFFAGALIVGLIIK